MKNTIENARNYFLDKDNTTSQIMVDFANEVCAQRLKDFAEEVKNKAETIRCNKGKGCGVTYCDQLCDEIDPSSIDKTLESFLTRNKL